MFYGIVIYLYFFDDERHKPPHIHAKYQGQDEFKRACVCFDTVCWPDNLDIAPETLFDRSVPLTGVRGLAL